MTRHSSSQKGNIAHECAEIVRPEGRYNHSDRCIPEGAGSCPLTTRTANTLRFKGTYWDWTKLQQYIERDTGGSGGGGLEKFHYFVPSTQTTNPLGAIHSTKISGNFGLKLNGSVRSNRKGFQKIIPPFEVDHFCRSKWNVPFDHTDPFSIPGPCCSVSSTYKIRQNGGKYLGVTKQSNEKKIERVKNFTIV